MFNKYSETTNNCSEYRQATWFCIHLVA